MDIKERPCYLALTKARWLTLFDGKQKHLRTMFQLFRRLGRFQWLGLKFNRFPYTSDGWSVYLDITLFSLTLSIGIHRGAYDESVNTGR